MTDISRTAKRAVILHGTDAEPMSGWRPWLKQKLEAEGYEVWVPALPQNHTPNMQVYNDFLFESGWDFADGIVIGHSSGAVEVLNLLMDERCPGIKLGVAVSVWNGTLIGETPDDAEQFKHTFPEGGFDFQRIKANADKLMFIHNEFDPYCSPADAEYLSGQLGAELIMLHHHAGDNSDHLGSPMSELPELWGAIKETL